MYKVSTQSRFSRRVNGGGWGDYSSMAIDSDGCIFWNAQEHFVTPISADWLTQLVSVKLNGCQ
jgi:hypothetical protein